MNTMEGVGGVEVDISAMDFSELSALRARIEDRVQEMREKGGPALRERFVQEAAAIGMTLEEIVETGGKRRRRKGKERRDRILAR